jgi:hypothetical protein
MIKTGRYGVVKWDPAGVTPVEVISLNAWKLSMKTNYEDVTCFNDSNKVYVPGMPDLSGSLGGFFNSASLVIIAAAMDTHIPGMLALMPDRNDVGIQFQGLAYLDADVDASLGAPKLASTFKAAGPWTVPGTVVATGAGPGTGNGSYTPSGAIAPANFAALTGVTATPATAWTVGQFVKLRDATLAHWTGTAWAVGAA